MANIRLLCALNMMYIYGILPSFFRSCPYYSRIYRNQYLDVPCDTDFIYLPSLSLSLSVCLCLRPCGTLGVPQPQGEPGGFTGTLSRSPGIHLPQIFDPTTLQANRQPIGCLVQTLESFSQRAWGEREAQVPKAIVSLDLIAFAFAAIAILIMQQWPLPAVTWLLLCVCKAICYSDSDPSFAYWL